MKWPVGSAFQVEATFLARSRHTRATHPLPSAKLSTSKEGLDSRELERHVRFQARALTREPLSFAVRPNEYSIGLLGADAFGE